MVFGQGELTLIQMQIISPSDTVKRVGLHLKHLGQRFFDVQLFSQEVFKWRL
jgi:hypothetical protein